MTRQEFLSPEQIRKHSIYTGVFEREVEWTLTVQTGITLPSGARTSIERSRGALGLRLFDIHLASSKPMYYGHSLHVSSGGYQRRSPTDGSATTTTCVTLWSPSNLYGLCARSRKGSSTYE